MSIKKDIYLTLADYLKAKLIETDDLPELKWVDKDMGQLNWLEDYHGFPMPAILISFGRTNWSNIGSVAQQGEAIIRFKIVFENYADSFDGSPNQDMAIKFFEFNEAVFEALQGLEGESFTKLMRVADEEDEDHANFIVTIMEFATVITDTSAFPETKLVDAEANTNVSYQNPSNKPAPNVKSDFIM